MIQNSFNRNKEKNTKSCGLTFTAAKSKIKWEYVAQYGGVTTRVNNNYGTTELPGNKHRQKSFRKIIDSTNYGWSNSENFFDIARAGISCTVLTNIYSTQKTTQKNRQEKPNRLNNLKR